MSWQCNTDNKKNCRYDIILGRGLLTVLVLDLNFSENIIISGERPYEGCLAPMADLSNYDFKSSTTKKVKMKEYFLNPYDNECLESDSSISSTRRMRRILDAKYK